MRTARLLITLACLCACLCASAVAQSHDDGPTLGRVEEFQNEEQDAPPGEETPGIELLTSGVPIKDDQGAISREETDSVKSAAETEGDEEEKPDQETQGTTAETAGDEEEEAVQENQGSTVVAPLGDLAAESQSIDAAYAREKEAEQETRGPTASPQADEAESEGGAKPAGGRVPHPRLSDGGRWKEPAAPAKEGGMQHPQASERDLKEAREYLKKYVAFPGADTCGDWAHTYKALHGRIRSGHSKNPRYLAFRGFDGLSNRLYGLVTAFMVSLLTSRALLITDGMLPLAFEPAQVTWSVPKALRKQMTVPDAEWDPSFKKRKAEYNWSDRQEVYKWLGVEAFPPLDSMRGLFSPQVLHFTTNKDVLARVLDPRSNGSAGHALRAMGMRRENAHACILRFLLRPKQEVFPTILPQVAALRLSGSPSMCFHIRIKDYTAWKWKGKANSDEIDPQTRDKVDKAMRCGQAVWASLPDSRSEEKRKRLKWLVLSNWVSVLEEVKRFFPSNTSLGQQDPNTSLEQHYPESSTPLQNVPARSNASEHFPGSLMLSPVQPRHIVMDPDKKLAMVGAVQDWLLFSLCDYYFISNSGFSKMSWAYSLTQKRVFKTNLYKKRWWSDKEEPAPVCHASNYYSMAQLM